MSVERRESSPVRCLLHSTRPAEYRSTSDPLCLLASRAEWGHAELTELVRTRFGRDGLVSFRDVFFLVESGVGLSGPSLFLL